jgi:tartrate/fumarate subfamily iron-sulfur-dependent hydro-lyase alpha chain
VSATVETTLRRAVEAAAAELYVWSLTDIPGDLRSALDAARERETHPVGRRILETIHTNVAVADEGKQLVCQDTGIAVYYARVGERFPLHPARIEEALREGTRRATLEHPLRSNTVHTLTRKPTGDNTGHRIPHVHWEFVPGWDGLDVKCVPKGSAPRT